MVLIMNFELSAVYDRLKFGQSVGSNSGQLQISSRSGCAAATTTLCHRRVFNGTVDRLSRKGQINCNMRVTFVLPQANLSGGTRVIAIYADRLQRRGHDVTVISIPAVRRSLLSKFKSLVYGEGWPKNQAPEPSFFDEIALPHRVLQMARPVVDDDVPDGDVVVATFWKTAPWVAALSPRKGAKAFLLQGYETLPGIHDPAIDAAWRLPLRKIVVSKWLAEIARDRFGDLLYTLFPTAWIRTNFTPLPGKNRPCPRLGCFMETRL